MYSKIKWVIPVWLGCITLPAPTNTCKYVCCKITNPLYRYNSPSFAPFLFYISFLVTVLWYDFGFFSLHSSLVIMWIFFFFLLRLSCFCYSPSFVFVSSLARVTLSSTSILSLIYFFVIGTALLCLPFFCHSLFFESNLLDTMSLFDCLAIMTLHVFTFECRINWFQLMNFKTERNS